MSKNQLIKNLIKNSSEIAKPRSFMAHVDYFKDDKHNKITASSIAHKWGQLTGESLWKTYPRGCLIMMAAKYNSVGCPFKSSFTTNEMVELLKHPRDAHIVDKHGNVNYENMESMMNECFEEYGDSSNKKLIMRLSKLNEYLEKIDKYEIEEKIPESGFLGVKFSKMAKSEWSAFFSIFSDLSIDGEKCITAETFLLFYTDSEKLYKKKIMGKL
jgi:hypothetical protein